MENLSVLMGVFDHLNKHSSKTFIEHYDSENGVIKLSGNIEINLKKVTTKKDLEKYLNVKEKPKADISNLICTDSYLFCY